MGQRWRLVVAALVGLIASSLGLAAVALESDGKTTENVSKASLCWRTEDFVVTQPCSPCSSFEAVGEPFAGRKRTPECRATGFIEHISCGKKEEIKSCRSAEMEARIFWKFEGSMIGLAAVFALLVVYRQRMLDRKALEKVRKQIESI
ncbi:protein JTB isoform X1 [Eublepharis macularius]|uniref:Protein JTB isoform X1 n=1 Tax=Eublepharis macularius TaxID=481883 RepID=A0AA97LJN3_EUBMA|nr:protein JTB isoform X1 [Eublepharis macularius]